jgi:hypothetical protein
LLTVRALSFTTLTVRALSFITLTVRALSFITLTVITRPFAVLIISARRALLHVCTLSVVTPNGALLPVGTLIIPSRRFLKVCSLPGDSLIVSPCLLLFFRRAGFSLPPFGLLCAVLMIFRQPVFCLTRF